MMSENVTYFIVSASVDQSPKTRASVTDELSGAYHFIDFRQYFNFIFVIANDNADINN